MAYRPVPKSIVPNNGCFGNWRVGRTLEAKFQWAHARDLKPEPEDLPKIEAKIANGLPDIPSSSAASAEKISADKTPADPSDKKKEDGKDDSKEDGKGG